MNRPPLHPIAARLALAALLAGALTAPRASADDEMPSLLSAAYGFLTDAAAQSRGAAIRSRAADGAMVFLPAPTSAARLSADPALAGGRREGSIAFAELSGNADLGVLLGPAILDVPGAPLRAEWVTVWTRAADDTWKVWLDGQSVTGPAAGRLGDVAMERGPDHVPIPLERAPGPGLLGWSGIDVGASTGGGGAGFGVGFGAGGGVGGPILSGKTQIDREVAHFTNTLLSTERSWMFDRVHQGVSVALTRYATEDVRVLRDGHPLAHGVLEATQAIGERKGTYDMTQAAHRISSSYQLAASYGTVRFKAKGAAHPDTLAFVHVWRILPDGRYRLMVDLENSIARGAPAR